MRLFVLLCEERNYFNIFALRDRFPYYLLLEIVQNEDMNLLIRGFFLELYVKLYVDVDPFFAFRMPKTLCFNKEELANLKTQALSLCD